MPTMRGNAHGPHASVVDGDRVIFNRDAHVLFLHGRQIGLQALRGFGSLSSRHSSNHAAPLAITTNSSAIARSTSAWPRNRPNTKTPRDSPSPFDGRIGLAATASSPEGSGRGGPDRTFQVDRPGSSLWNVWPGVGRADPLMSQPRQHQPATNPSGVGASPAAPGVARFASIIAFDNSICWARS